MIFHIEIEAQASQSPRLDREVLEKSLALKLAKGDFFDSNFNLPILRVGSYKIESGTVRRI